MTRIAIAGFQHETNTFATAKAGFHEFDIADSWPGLLAGEAVIAQTLGLNLPVAGFAAAARRATGVELLPLMWCAAEPSGHVTDEAFERIVGMLIDGLRGAGRVDGLYLDLHGAMVTESHDDGEGELLRRLRAELGGDLSIVASLDLHANVTPAMVDHATAMTLYRTYPHLDMAATGARCLPIVMRAIDGAVPCKAFRQAPYLIPLHAQFTGAEPCRSLYRALDELDGEGVSADIALGFTAADIFDAGPSVVAYAPDQALADAVADRLIGAIAAAEGAFDCHMLSPAEAVRAAMANRSDKPVVIADVQDNPGAGASSDTTGLLAALVAEGAEGAVLGLLDDPEMAARAHEAGMGGVIEGPLGGKSGLSGQAPFEGRFRVEALSDGQCRYTGEMYGGGVAVLGPCAVLRVEDARSDVRVVVGSHRSQCLDRAIFTHIGIDPARQRIVAVKSTAHFRADFDPIAAETLVAAAPGGFPCDLAAIPYRRLRPGVRLGPRGPVFAG